MQYTTSLITCGSSGVIRSMVIPGPVVEVVGDPSSGGLGAQPPDAENGLILHVQRMAWNSVQHLKKHINEWSDMYLHKFYFTFDMDTGASKKCYRVVLKINVFQCSYLHMQHALYKP